MKPVCRLPLLLLGALFLLPGCGVLTPDPEPQELALQTLDCRMKPAGDTVTLLHSGNALELRSGSRRALFNGTAVFLTTAPKRDESGVWRVTAIDRDTVIKPLLHRFTGYPRRIRTVLVDPGHGGDEPGAKGSRHLEKELNLSLAGKLRAELEKRGFTVRMTREDDTELSLDRRGDLSGETGADLFISVHHNAGGKNSTGIETYSLTPAGARSTNGGGPYPEIPGDRFVPASVNLSYEVESRLAPATGLPDRGSKHARFRVLVRARCPAILIEGGFIDHPAEEAKIADQEQQQRAAVAIAEAVAAFNRLSVE